MTLLIEKSKEAADADVLMLTAERGMVDPVIEWRLDTGCGTWLYAVRGSDDRRDWLEVALWT